MKEELISYKTAKLAKEKGFGGEGLCTDNKYGFEGLLLNSPCNNQSHFCREDEFSAPTQSLLQKWLRDEHKIFIDITHSHRDLSKYTFHVYTDWESLTKKVKKAFNDELIHLETYEEALEEGLFEALKLIKL